MRRAALPMLMVLLADSASAEALDQEKIGRMLDQHDAARQAQRFVAVEADNGTILKVDMNSIHRGTDSAIVFAYVDAGNPEDHLKMRGYQFDCQGHFSLIGLGSSQMLDAPPRSVVAQISRLACAAPVGTLPK